MEMIPSAECTSLSSRFILQALGDQRGIYLPVHISGERGGEAGRQEQLISPLFNLIFGALCGSV